MACVLLVMKIYKLEDIKNRKLADKNTPLPTTFADLNKAINKSAELIGLTPFQMEMALNLKQIRPETNIHFRTQAATAILPMITAE